MTKKKKMTSPRLKHWSPTQQEHHPVSHIFGRRGRLASPVTINRLIVARNGMEA